MQPVRPASLYVGNCVENASTFSAPDPHHSLKANLSGEVALQVLLQFPLKSRGVDVVEGWVVENAAGRKL